MAEVFNKKHPELKRGEVFVTNIFLRRSPIGIFEGDNRSDWDCIYWKTKRMGIVAYNNNGKKLSENSRPVFAKRSEIKKAGLDPDKL